MKKFCIVISILIIIVSSAIGIETLKLKDTNAWYQFGEKNAIRVTIPAKEQIKEDIVYDTFLSISQQYNATIVKSKYIWNDNNLHIVKAVYINNGLENISLLSGRELSKDDNNSTLFLSTEQSNDKDQIGVIKDVFNDNFIEIMTFNRYIDMHMSLYGEYTIKLTSTADIGPCLDDIAGRLNISVEELTSNVNISLALTNQTLSILSSIQKILFIGFMIGLFYYGIYQFKTIGIYKLNGVSLDSIYLQLVKPIFLVQWIVALIIQILIIFLIKYMTRTIFLSILINSLKYLLVSFLITGLLYYIVSKVKISQLLKKEMNDSGLMTMNYIVKVITLSLLFYFFASSIVSFNNAVQLKEKSDLWKQYSDYAVVQYGENQDEESTYFYSHLFSEENKLITNNFFKALNGIGALYANTEKMSAAVNFYGGSPIETWDIIAGIEVTDAIKQLQLINYTVNTNMLDKLMIKDMDGNPIRIDNKELDRILLIPYSKETNAEDILKLYQMNSANDNKDMLLYKYFIYDDTKNNTFFSFNTALENINVISPVFELLTDNNVHANDLVMLFNTGINSPVKLPMNGKNLDEFSTEMQEFYDTYLENKGGTQHFQTLYGIFGEEIEFSESQLRQSFYLISIIIIVYLFVILYFTILYLKLNVRKISVQKLNGYSLMESLKPYLKSVILLDVVCYIIYIFSINYWFGLEIGSNRYNLSMHPLAYFGGLILILSEIIIIYIFIKRIDKKAISGYLKGDLYGSN